MKPVLKWAGGKSQLLDAIQALMPNEYLNYFEPFIGGGALLFSVCPKRAIINDCNEQLINLYLQIKSNPLELIADVNKYDSKEANSEYYYEVRERYNTKIQNNEIDTECAALMIWLNKHCFNGLYRVNAKGLFNVPFNNRKKGMSIDQDNIIEISKYFNDNEIEILCGDFEDVCENVQSGDFVYFDSPYVPESITASFTDYTKEGFTINDHKRLAALFERLDHKGVKVLLSNNDVPLVRELYKNYSIKELDVKRMINRNADSRKGKEVLIYNYDI